MHNYNYVYFNCDPIVDEENYNYSTACEVWRILGVFDVERTDPEDSTKTITEQRMKLVIGNILEKRAFNVSSNNDWTVAPLNTYLNGDYYNGTATNGLKQSARNMIGIAKYYLGAISWGDATERFGSIEKIYGEERGNNLCGACGKDNEKLTWSGKISLMYPSDMYMVYANEVDKNCYNKPNYCYTASNPVGIPKSGWLYNTNLIDGENPTTTWLLSPFINSNDALRIYDNGSFVTFKTSNNSGVRPVVYLKSSIKIKSGTGEVGNPYVLE